MPKLLRLIAAVLLATITTATLAGQPKAPAKADAMVQFQRDLVNVLALRAEAQPLLGAALLARTLPDPPQLVSFHALLQRALQAPDVGPATHWVALVDCDAQARACPNPAALQALETAAPDNAAVWLMALGQAMQQGDPAGARTALARAAAANSYDDYAGVSLQALARAAGTLPPPKALYAEHGVANSAAGVRAILVFGLGSMQPVPGFQGAARICTQHADDASTASQCLQLAKTLVWGSSPLARALGLHLQATLAQDATVRKQAQQARRDLTWQVHNFGQLTLRSRHDPAVAQNLLRLARTGGTRMSLILAALRAADIATTAPNDWKPAAKGG